MSRTSHHSTEYRNYSSKTGSNSYGVHIPYTLHQNIFLFKKRFLVYLWKYYKHVYKNCLYIYIYIYIYDHAWRWYITCVYYIIFTNKVETLKKIITYNLCNVFIIYIYIYIYIQNLCYMFAIFPKCTRNLKTLNNWSHLKRMQ